MRASKLRAIRRVGGIKFPIPRRTLTFELITKIVEDSGFGLMIDNIYTKSSFALRVNSPSAVDTFTITDAEVTLNA